MINHLDGDDAVFDFCSEVRKNIKQRQKVRQSNIDKFRVRPQIDDKDEVIFESGIWDIRDIPSATTVYDALLDETLFEGPIMLALPNRTGSIFYNVAVYDRTLRSVLQAIHGFYREYLKEYELDNFHLGGIMEEDGAWRVYLETLA